MSLVIVEPDAAQAIKSLLSAKGLPGPVRIETQFTGCCDPSLGLLVDEARESDLVEETDGLTFVVSPETAELAGEVRIALGVDSQRTTFLLTSKKPLSEWDGFTSCEIKS
jgi:Fe-S cluster assembly iron-binding protein IscA